jgi:tetratricopeptide (TPR) repeat protein
MLKHNCILTLLFGLLCLVSWAQAPGDAALVAALNGRRFLEAESMAEASLKSRPNDPWLWTAHGMALDGLGKADESLENLDKALRLNARFVPALKAAAQLTYRQRDKRAAGYLKRLLELKPDEAAAHGMAAVLDFEAHDCAGAIRHFEQSGQLALSTQVAATEYASCLLSMHRTADAVRVLTQARALYPASRNLRYDLALAQVDNGQRDAALATLQSAADDDPGILNLRALVESAAGDLELAFADLKRAVEMDPAGERNYLDLALLCLDHSQEQLAADVLTAGIARLPNDAALYSVRGIAYAQLSKYDEAQKDFARATELDPAKPLGQVASTVLYVDTDQPEKARQALREQLKKTPDDAVANTLLANLLVHQGAAPGTAEFDEAKAVLARALHTNPDAVDALVLLGKMDLDANDLPGAQGALERAERLEPDNRTMLNQMLVIFRKLGRQQDAKRVAERLAASLSEEARKRNGDAVRTGPER